MFLNISNISNVLQFNFVAPQQFLCNFLQLLTKSLSPFGSVGVWVSVPFYTAFFPQHPSVHHSTSVFVFLNQASMSRKAEREKQGEIG